jgi:hypothetical protein
MESTLPKYIGEISNQIKKTILHAFITQTHTSYIGKVQGMERTMTKSIDSRKGIHNKGLES